MTILYSQAPLYPVVGQRVVLGATQVPTGQRVRWRLISAPATSKLELYSTRNLLYLDDGRFDPDIEGKYVLEAVVESFASHIPHFAGDGSATSNPVEEWTELSTTSKSVYVGCKMQRTLGLAPDQCTLTMYCIDTASTCGVLTSFYNEELAPKLEDPTSDRARIAIGAPDVIESLARIGGKGYAGLDNLISTSGDLETSALQNPFYVGSGTYQYGLLYLLRNAYSTHCGLTTNGAHGTTGAVDEVTAPAATSVATLYALLNEIKTNFPAHAARGSTIHPDGSVTVTITAANATTQATAEALANELRTKYEAHRSNGQHATPGDGMSTSRISAQACWDYDSCVLLANDIRSKFNAHIVQIQSAADYHLLDDTDNEPVGADPMDGASMVSIVNEFADCLHAHVSNINSDTDETKGYHFAVDPKSALDRFPRAANEEQAIALLDYVVYAYMSHVDTRGPWHGGQSVTGGCLPNPGEAWTQLWGITKLHCDFMLAAHSAALGTPANGLTAQTQLISLGGFAKG